MDDKVFNLLEKMYADMNDKFEQVNQRFDKLENRITKIESITENDIKPSVKMCLDEVVSVKEKQVEHDQRFDTLEDKINWVKDQQKIDGIKIDGMKANIEKNTKTLEEVKEEVARHEEVIIKRVK